MREEQTKLLFFFFTLEAGHRRRPHSIAEKLLCGIVLVQYSSYPKFDCEHG